MLVMARRNLSSAPRRVWSGRRVWWLGGNLPSGYREAGEQEYRQRFPKGKNPGAWAVNERTGKLVQRSRIKGAAGGGSGGKQKPPEKAGGSAGGLRRAEALVKSDAPSAYIKAEKLYRSALAGFKRAKAKLSPGSPEFEDEFIKVLRPAEVMASAAVSPSPDGSVDPRAKAADDRSLKEVAGELDRLAGGKLRDFDAPNLLKHLDGPEPKSKARPKSKAKSRPQKTWTDDAAAMNPHEANAMLGGDEGTANLVKALSTEGRSKSVSRLAEKAAASEKFARAVLFFGRDMDERLAHLEKRKGQSVSEAVSEHLAGVAAGKAVREAQAGKVRNALHAMGMAAGLAPGAAKAVARLGAKAQQKLAKVAGGGAVRVEAIKEVGKEIGRDLKTKGSSWLQQGKKAVGSFLSWLGKKKAWARIGSVAAVGAAAVAGAAGVMAVGAGVAFATGIGGGVGLGIGAGVGAGGLFFGVRAGQLMMSLSDYLTDQADTEDEAVERRGFSGVTSDGSGLARKKFGVAKGRGVGKNNPAYDGLAEEAKSSFGRMIRHKGYNPDGWEPKVSGLKIDGDKAHALIDVSGSDAFPSIKRAKLTFRLPPQYRKKK